MAQKVTRIAGKVNRSVQGMKVRSEGSKRRRKENKARMEAAEQKVVEQKIKIKKLKKHIDDLEGEFRVT